MDGNRAAAHEILTALDDGRPSPVAFARTTPAAWWAGQLGGVKFILSTCRTAFAWTARRRMLPPFAENPFAASCLDRLKDRQAGTTPQVFTPDKERAFFAACNDWQRPLFEVLAEYGLRAGEIV